MLHCFEAVGIENLTDKIVAKYPNLTGNDKLHVCCTILNRQIIYFDRDLIVDCPRWVLISDLVDNEEWSFLMNKSAWQYLTCRKAS